MRPRRARRDRPHLDEVWRRSEANLDEAYEAARRADVVQLNVAADQSLGEAVDALVAAEQRRSSADADRVERINALRRAVELKIDVTTSNGMRPWSQSATARRVVVSEVAAALRIPEGSAQLLINESQVLGETLTATLGALQRGELSYRHAKSIVDHAQSLPEDLRREFETRVLPFAAKLTPSKFDLKARTVRERMDATTIKTRHLSALEKRETTWEPARDGMGWLHYYGSAEATLAAYNRVTDKAVALQGPDESRTLSQLRADVVADLLLDGEAPSTGRAGIRPTVVLTIPALSLLGVPSASGELEPATLDGYGPIDIDVARRLAGGAKSWIRVLTHPVTGVTLRVENRKRTIPSALRTWLRIRDRVCRKVGCNRSVRHSEIDHTQEWQHGGQHAHDNLAFLCPQHHAEKHHTSIGMRHLPNGDIEWTLPSGKTYISEPDVRMDGHSAA